MTVFLAESSASTERFRLSLGQEAETVTSARELRDYLNKHENEQLVVINPEVPLEVATDIAEQYRLARPSLGFLLIRYRLEVSILSRAMQAGIREVIGSDDAAALVAAARRSNDVSAHLAESSSLTADGKPAGKVILVFSAKGGCGKTTLSTNLARAISENEDASVALVDFDLQFGDVAVALQLEPAKTISNAIRMQESIDLAAIKGLMTSTDRTNLQALLAPVDPADVEFITPQLADKILRGLQSSYDYIVIDSPPAFTEVILKAFDLADEYLLLTTLDLPSIKNLKVTLGTLDALGMPKSKWNVIVNRSTTDTGLNVKDVEDAIGLEVAGQIPNSEIVPTMVNQGKTVVDGSPKHEVAQAIRSITRYVMGETETIASLGKGKGKKPKKTKQRRSLFGRKAK
ncbi:MAG: CpaE family protein [Micrococcales bacterium]